MLGTLISSRQQGSQFELIIAFILKKSANKSPWTSYDPLLATSGDQKAYDSGGWP